MNRPRVLLQTLIAVAGCLTLSVDRAEAGGYANRAGCGCGSCISYQVVERQVMVPQLVPQRRVVQVVECQPEVRERMIPCQRLVPEVQQVVDHYIAMVPQREVRQCRYVVSRPIWREEEYEYTVQVPEQVKHEGVRQVCRPVMEQRTCRVTVDRGHWEDVKCGGCGACGGCGTCRVWCPNLVVEEVPVTVCRMEIVNEPCTYYTTVFRPEKRNGVRRICEFVHEEQVRDVQYTVMIPEKRERVRNVTTFRTEIEQRPQRYTVMVPRKVEREIVEMVCQMVPRMITCKIPVVTCGGRCGCGH